MSNMQPALKARADAWAYVRRFGALDVGPSMGLPRQANKFNISSVIGPNHNAWPGSSIRGRFWVVLPCTGSLLGDSEPDDPED